MTALSTSGANKPRNRKPRPIVCLETGEVYKSVSAAARAVGLKGGSAISRAAARGYIAGGYHWAYVE